MTISPNRLKERAYPTQGKARVSRARMAELVDAPASGAGAGNGVEVRVLFRAPFFCSNMFILGLEMRGKHIFLAFVVRGRSAPLVTIKGA